MLGLALCCYVLALPGATGASPGQLVADLGPTLQQYLTGPLAAVPAGLSGRPEAEAPGSCRMGR